MVNCLLHVIDHSIGDNQQNVELLILLSAFHIFCHIIHKFNYWGEVSGSIQLNSVDCVLVSFNHAINPLAFGVKDITVQGETVLCLLSFWWDDCTEAKSWDLFVRVIVLQNVADRLDCI